MNFPVLQDGNESLTHLLILSDVRKQPNLIETISGEEADVAVRIGAQVVQVQRGRPGVRSVVVTAAANRHSH